MASYVFNTQILSAAKVGIGFPIPPSTFYPLTAAGIGIVSLAANHVGLAFNSLPLTTKTVTHTSVFGSVFNINTAYHNQPIALFQNANHLDPGGITRNTYTVFLFNSGFLASPPATLLINSRDVSTPEHRRKWLLGYF